MADGTSRVYAPSEPTQVMSARARPMSAFYDIFAGLLKWRIWISLSWQEFTSTYRRSYIGLLWVMLSFAAFVFVKLIVFSSLIDGVDANYYNAYLVVGIYTWIYFGTTVSSSPDTFLSAQGWIRSEPLPLSIYIYKNIMRELYNFAITFAVVLAAFYYIGYAFVPGSAYSILAVLFFILTAFSLKLLLGVVSARFRDVSHLVKAIMLPMMFLTPIFWLPEQMGDLMQVLWWNPLFHYMEIFRAPLLTGELPMESWRFAGITYGIVTVAAFAVFIRYRQRIVFWF